SLNIQSRRSRLVAICDSAHRRGRAFALAILMDRFRSMRMGISRPSEVLTTPFFRRLLHLDGVGADPEAMRRAIEKDELARLFRRAGETLRLLDRHGT